MSRRDLMTGLAAVAGVGLLPGVARAEDSLRLAGRGFGGRWRVLLPLGAPAAALAPRIAAALQAVDDAMNPFRPDSEIGRFNAGTGDMRVSATFAAVTRAALDMARLSDGAFDPTVGPAVNRYGFGPVRGPMGDWRDLGCADDEITRAGPATLDLCAIAKGHAADLVANLLREEGIAEFLVEISGEIRAEGRDWLIGVADPLAAGEAYCRLRLSSGAIATSGDAVHAVAIAAKRFSHTIDPATAAPVTNAVASVSVLAETGMRADALATALWVMGEERGLAFAAAQGVGVLYLIRAGSGLRVRANAAFQAVMEA